MMVNLNVLALWMFLPFCIGDSLKISDLLRLPLKPNELIGGWTAIDPNSLPVLTVAKFAIEKTFPDASPDFKTVSAKKQVVAGVNYDLVIDVTIPGNPCVVNHFVVWDRFGLKTLTLSEKLKSQKCHSD